MLAVLQHEGRQHVEDHRHARQAPCQHGKEGLYLCLIKVHQDALQHQQYRLAIGRQRGRPALVQQRAFQINVGGRGQQPAAQGNHLGQVHVHPGRDSRSPQTLETCINTGANLRHDGIGMLSDEGLHLVIDQRRPAAAARLRHPRSLEAVEVVIDHRQHSWRFSVLQQRLGLVLLHGLGPQRDQHRFRQGTDRGRRDLVGHGDSSFIGRQHAACVLPRYANDSQSD